MATQLQDIPEALLSDFDIVGDVGLVADPQQRLLETLAKDPRDIVYTPHNGGHWLVTSHELGREILSNADLFGSFPIGIPANMEQRPRLIPLESDAAAHRRYRRLLLPIFEPAAVQQLQAGAETLAQEILEDVLPEGEFDFLWRVAKPISMGLFVRQLGLEPERLDEFYAWETGFYRAPTMEERIECGQNIGAYLSAVVNQHVEHPKDDIVTMLLNVEVEGERLSQEEVQSICYLLFLASIDTVATMLSFIVRHLARDQALFRRLKEDRTAIADSVDELLRMHAFINLNRICERDTVFHGVAFRAGDNIVVPSFVTDRDERVFADPDAFNADRSKREKNQHHAFGAGAHKCIGLHVAKMEVRVVLEALFDRISSLELVSESAVTGHGGTTMGLDTIPIKVTLE
ncbi:cytochrome P450 [Luminiphilus sp.]|nr:cytochrome P450 [Luminiphilus sp.]MDA8985888.1 cytochrome P450 [Luminiphilus sp.]